MISLSYDTSTARHPLTGQDADHEPTFGTVVASVGRFQRRNFLFKGPDGELAQADAVLHQDPQGTAVGDKIVVASENFRVAIVELKTDPIFGHRHERIVLQRWVH